MTPPTNETRPTKAQFELTVKAAKLTVTNPSVEKIMPNLWANAITVIFLASELEKRNLELWKQLLDGDAVDDIAKFKVSFLEADRNLWKAKAEHLASELERAKRMAEFYGDEKSYVINHHQEPVLDDNGQRARDFLKGGG
jgi:hypothetical protein